MKKKGQEGRKKSLKTHYRNGGRNVVLSTLEKTVDLAKKEGKR